MREKEARSEKVDKKGIPSLSKNFSIDPGLLVIEFYWTSIWPSIESN